MSGECSATLAGAGVVLRPYRGSADLKGVEAVRAAVRDADGDVWLPGPDGSDDPDAEHPFCLIAEADSGETVGFTWMQWWDEADRTRIYLLLGGIAPGWRRRGVGTALLRLQEERVAAFDRAESSRTGPAVFGINVAPAQLASLALVTANDYRMAFTSVDMAYEIDGLPDGPYGPLPGGLVLRPVEEEHHPAIHRVIEECFAGARNGYQARTYEEYLHDVQDVDVWCVAWADDEIAAVVVNELQPDGTALTPWVGVLPAWRKHGVGLALMRHTLRVLADRGVSTARLSTVQENPDNSVGLYERAGYRVVSRQPRYRKPVRS